MPRSQRSVLLAGLLLLAPAMAVGAQASGRNALVIGNSSYRPGYELRNPVADARGVARALATLGFRVTLLEDSDLATVQRALDSFVPASVEGDAAIIYYAGHGATIDRRNFMLPVDFSMSSFDRINEEALDTDRLVQALSSTHSRMKILFFDACRNNPLESRGAKPLAKPDEKVPDLDNLQIVYSTTQGMTATDGQGNNSPFASAVITSLEEPRPEVSRLLKVVRDAVRDATSGRQTIWLEGFLTVPAYFTTASVSPGEVTQLAEPEAPVGEGEIFPTSNDEALDPSQLEGLDAAQLRLARNEIFARAGRKFRDPALAEHFARFSWYSPTTFDPVLNPLEEENVALIRRFELKGSAPQQGFLFADSDRRLLSDADLSGLSRQQLRMARNEIYARRGRKFVRKEVREYFEQFSWYDPRFKEVALSNIEQRNVDLIAKRER